MVNVVRDGENMQISRDDIVVGDVIRLSIGDILEADGVLIEGFDLEMDESALTGEPLLIKKSVLPLLIFHRVWTNSNSMCALTIY